MGLGLGVGCVLVFFVAFAFGWAAFAVVSFALFAGSRSAFVLVAPRDGGFVFPYCWFAFGAGFGPSRVGFGRVRWFRFIFSFVRALVLVDWEHCVIKYPCLNSAPSITAAHSGRRSRIRRF